MINTLEEALQYILQLEAENKAYAKKHGVNHYVLFNGWYNNLEPREIDDFIKDLETIK